ncbi:hypothetical protein ACRQ5D_14620 [Mucilaginibacter sp. P25]|uniref:hypothetical protein n=1 Tax=Mucilaginibacter sp. P25 TaxID=3423945 RepID=UPI003D7B2D15
MEELFIKKLSFTKRPIPIPADYRPMYKIAIIVLILKLCCRSDKASLLKLHLFSWALASKKHTALLADYISKNFVGEFSVWGIEPALNRALQLATAEKICDIVDGKNYQLSAEKGLQFFNMIMSDNEILVDEKAFLKSLGKNTITDSRINTMTKQWSLFYVEN